MAPITITEEAKRTANLRVLQRIDPSITDIVGSATHVVLYEFIERSQKWEKQNCEGAFCLIESFISILVLTFQH